jgi:hypothetical protein
MAKNITLPAAFFLDTNILDALPETLESGELNSLISEAKDVHCKVYLPDVVAREWIKHRLDNAVNSYADIRKGSDHLRKYIDATPNFKLKGEAIFDAVFKVGIQRIKNAGLRILRPPFIKTRPITSNAVFEVAPFTHSNKGFKDELVVLSMLDVVGRWNYKSCVLVTEDKHFSEKDISGRFKQFDVDFRVVNNLQTATKLIVDTLDEATQRRYEEVIRGVTEYVKSRWEEISSKIIEKVNSDGVSDFRLSYGSAYTYREGTVKRVVSVKPLEITGALPGIPDESTGLTPITISVDVELELEYERMEVDWTDVFFQKIKTTEEKREFKPGRYSRVVETQTVNASIEAKARYSDDKWEGFIISEVQV